MWSCLDSVVEGRGADCLSFDFLPVDSSDDIASLESALSGCQAALDLHDYCPAGSNPALTHLGLLLTKVIRMPRSFEYTAVVRSVTSGGALGLSLFGPFGVGCSSSVRIPFALKQLVGFDVRL